MPSRVSSTVANWAGWLTSQSFWGLRRRRAPFPPALVGSAEACPRGPSGRDKLRDGKSRCEDLGLEVRDVLRVDQLVIDRRNGILPDQLLRRDLRAEIANARAHVAVGELEPRAGKRVRELVRMLVKAPGDLLVGRIHPQREVRDQHGWRVTLRRVEGIRDRRDVGFRLELIGAGRAL